jgi:hypothetical protein
MKKIVHITLLLLMACEIPTESYENPLDVEAAGDNGIETACPGFLS